MIGEENTLCHGSVKCVTAKNLENHPKMLQVILGVNTVYQNIVKINYDEFTDEGAECLVHDAHKHARRIREAEWHHEPVIEAFAWLECRLPFVVRSDADLVIPAP